MKYLDMNLTNMCKTKYVQDLYEQNSDEQIQRPESMEGYSICMVGRVSVA